jgi:small subunit ribosomal protein S2
MTWVRDLSADGKTLLFVGTKKQAQETIEEEARRCDMPYVNRRWLGGMLTNFITIEKRIRRLEELEQRKTMGDFDRLPKKEQSRLEDELERLQRLLGGMRGRYRLPDAVFIVDPHREEIAVAESRRAEIPIVAMVDTNCNPDVIDYPIPSNDDAIRAIRLLVGKVADSIIEGRQQHESAQADRDELSEDGELDEEAAEKVGAVDLADLPPEWTRDVAPGTEAESVTAAVEGGGADDAMLVAGVVARGLDQAASLAIEPAGSVVPVPARGARASSSRRAAEPASAGGEALSTALESGPPPSEAAVSDVPPAEAEAVATAAEDVVARVNPDNGAGTELPAGTVTAEVRPEDQEPIAGAEERAKSVQGA